MSFSIGNSRPYQLSMAAICTLLASGGFVAAGYVGTSTADAAAMLSAQESSHTTSTPADIDPAGFDAILAQGFGVKVSFADTLILAQKPAAKQVFDLTNPDGNTPQLARSVNAMRGDLPEISAELISQVRKDILTASYQGLGHSYVWGGTSFANGWDCSGFVQWAYRQAGVGLPRTEQWLPMVETNNPQPGDIVVQNPDGPNHWSHIGIYIGNGKMISALNPSVGTILHAPEATSSSSTYFTMPGFATADERAKAAAEQATNKPSSTTEPGQSPTTVPSTTATVKPATTAPATTGPGATGPGTTAPATATPTTPTTAPATTAPATTAPATTSPGTTVPGTTAPATATPTTPISTTEPAPTTSEASPAETTDGGSAASITADPSVTDEPVSPAATSDAHTRYATADPELSESAVSSP
ncbi:NlpC/P60 family protein [Arthrobacter sp. TWP1-1]|uniref:NlpC/P60 family protein n=1 Tax=Arthrobacter sp. TWP1-1 TaxID=2804568 RepID=UPI003CF98CB4